MTTQTIYVGPLEDLLRDADITAIYLDTDSIRYEKDGHLHTSTLAFTDEAQRRAVIDSIVTAGGETLSAANPVVACTLVDGTTVHADCDPLTLTLHKQR